MAVIGIREGYSEFRGYQTWFRITGDLQAKKPPVVILHGGPGAAHDYTDAFKLLANGGRAVIGFRVSSRERVDELYSQLTADGYAGQQPPYDAFWGARYAIVEDPDGNPVGIMSPSDPDRRSRPDFP